MKKSLLITITAVLVLAVCILTAGCVDNSPSEEVITDITGNWIIGNPIIYSSEKGFTEAADTGYDVFTCTEQKGRLVKMEMKDVQRPCYLAISDKNATSMFTDSSYGNVREYLTGKIVEDGNAIIFASVSCNKETGELRAIFDPRTKEGSAPIEKPDEIEMIPTGTWELELQTSLMNGELIDAENLPEDPKVPFTLTVTESNGPVFCGTIQAEGLFTKNFAGVIIDKLDQVSVALLMDNDGKLWELRFFYNSGVKLWEFTFERSGCFSSAEMSGLAPDYTSGTKTWNSPSMKSLGNNGYKETELPVQSVVTQVNDMRKTDLSNGGLYVGKISPFGEVRCIGVSQSGITYYTSEGFIGDDGKLYAFTAVYDTETNLPAEIVERVYTAA